MPRTSLPRTTAPRARGLVLFALMAACASSEPLDMALGPASEVIEIEVLGDGFVKLDGRRIPLELCILELRQRTRPMTDDERKGLRPHVRVPEGAGASSAADVERLLVELHLMGIVQARYL